MKKMLLIVDPQIDFIDGTLPVPGATEAMDSLAAYIAAHGAEYERIVVTADWHPYTHCSFAPNGGQWPRHCVAFSAGAAVWPALYEAVNAACDCAEVLTKGTSADTEEYSIFANKRSAERLNSLMAGGIERIDLCGIAGDVCVADTLTDGIARYGADRFRVLRDFCPSLDGGKRITDLTDKYKLA